MAKRGRGGQEKKRSPSFVGGGDEGKESPLIVEVLAKRRLSPQREITPEGERVLALERYTVKAEEDCWKVSRKDIVHTVTHSSKTSHGWACDCRYFLMKGGTSVCKHIGAVISAIKMRPEMAASGDFRKIPTYDPFAISLLPNFRIKDEPSLSKEEVVARAFLGKDKDSAVVRCTLEREENQYGVPLLSSRDKRASKRYAVAVVYEGPATRGKKVRIGYVPNFYLVKNPDLLDTQRKEFMVAVNVSRLKVGADSSVVFVNAKVFGVKDRGAPEEIEIIEPSRGDEEGEG
ncbi:MAG: hypothetical protein QXH08_00150 [Candidatus Hadarchaeales archaeon]